MIVERTTGLVGLGWEFHIIFFDGISVVMKDKKQQKKIDWTSSLSCSINGVLCTTFDVFSFRVLVFLFGSFTGTSRPPLTFPLRKEVEVSIHHQPDIIPRLLKSRGRLKITDWGTDTGGTLFVGWTG